MEREEYPGISTLLHGFTNPENLHRVLHRRDTKATIAAGREPPAHEEGEGLGPSKPGEVVSR